MRGMGGASCSLRLKDLLLKYGCNPNQKPAKIFMKNNSDLPLDVLNGNPGYINLLDAFNSWQLVKELKDATGLSSAASFKHVSPAGVAVCQELSEIEKKIYFAENISLSPIASAYVRARGTDRMSSYGDFVALSDTCDETAAEFLKTEVSDGIIAPGYTGKALNILKNKRKGTYTVLKIDKNYVPDTIENKDIFGITFQQARNEVILNAKCLTSNIVTNNKALSDHAVRDLILSLITVKYTQSNSVCYSKDGQSIGIGAGQQSRIHCTRLAGDKADYWYLRQHPKVLELPFTDSIKRPDRDNIIDLYIGGDSSNLFENNAWKPFFKYKPIHLTAEEKNSWLAGLTNVALGSDAFFPFEDNIERAAGSGVKYISQPGGAMRDDAVIASCNKYDMVMSFTGIRLFHH